MYSKKHDWCLQTAALPFTDVQNGCLIFKHLYPWCDKHGLITIVIPKILCTIKINEYLSNIQSPDPPPPSLPTPDHSAIQFPTHTAISSILPSSIARNSLELKKKEFFRPSEGLLDTFGKKMFKFHEGVKKCHFSERAGMAVPCQCGPQESLAGSEKFLLFQVSMNSKHTVGRKNGHSPVLPFSIARTSQEPKTKRIFEVQRGILKGRTNRARPSRPWLKSCQNGTF